MLNIFAIFIGGGIGSVTRYLINLILRAQSINFPFATLSVNIVGSFILGFAAMLFWQRAELHHSLKLAITVGFCGGLTTFSTFSWEAFDFVKHGDYLLAVLYVFVSVVACVSAVSLGAFLARYV